MKSKLLLAMLSVVVLTSQASAQRYLFPWNAKHDAAKYDALSEARHDYATAVQRLPPVDVPQQPAAAPLYSAPVVAPQPFPYVAPQVQAPTDEPQSNIAMIVGWIVAAICAYFGIPAATSNFLRKTAEQQTDRILNELRDNTTVTQSIAAKVNAKQ